VYLYWVHGLPEVLTPYTYFSDCSELSEKENEARKNLVDNHVLKQNVGDAFSKAVSTN